MSFGIDQVVVSGGGEVGDTGRGDFVDRNSHRAVLEEGFFKVEDVVGDHLGAFRGQFPDVFREGRFTVEGGGKIDVGFWREVVDDLRHRPALVRRPFRFPGYVGFKDFDRGRISAGIDFTGKVAAEDVARFRGGHRSAAVGRFGCLVEGVGENPDGDSAAVDGELFASFAFAFPRFQLLQALGYDFAGGAGAGGGDWRKRLGHTGHTGDAANPAQRARLGRDRDRLVAGTDVDDLCPGAAQCIDAGASPGVKAHVGEHPLAMPHQAAGTFYGEAQCSCLFGRRRRAQRGPRQLGQSGRES